MAIREHAAATLPHHLRRGSVIALLSSALVLTAAVPAVASPPVDLGGAYILDEAGVLGGQASRVDAALDRLFDTTGAALYVVTVGRFEGSVDALAWADESAALSGLGDRDTLLAIAVDDREYATSVGVAFAATDAQLSQAEEALVADLVVEDDYSKTLNWLGRLEEAIPTCRIIRCQIVRGDRGNDVHLDLQIQIPILKS
jgi:hypothetical protein